MKSGSTFALRLHPGADLAQAITAAVRDRGLQAGFVVSGIGSLTVAAIRYADAPDATVIPGPLEILTLQGSVSPEGIHLHVSVADAHGVVRGGHLSKGCTIRTTAEILIADVPGWRFTRPFDPQTGYRELDVQPVPKSSNI